MSENTSIISLHLVVPHDANLPFFFYPLAYSEKLPSIVVKGQQLFANASLDYKVPIGTASQLALTTQKQLLDSMPQTVIPYLREILKSLNIIVVLTHTRKSKAGDCSLNSLQGYARITLNRDTNQWKMLCVLLHEMAHALNSIQISAHDIVWQTIFKCLLCNFYSYFPEKYRDELLWGIAYTPVSLKSNNFNGKAVLFSPEDDADLEKRAINEQNGWFLGVKPCQCTLDIDFDWSYEPLKPTLMWYYIKGRLYFPYEWTKGLRMLKALRQMDYAAQSYVWNLYIREYGYGAYKYAQNAIYNWLSGRVYCYVYYRFEKLVPMAFSLKQKKALCKALISASDQAEKMRKIRCNKYEEVILIRKADWPIKCRALIRKIQKKQIDFAYGFDYEKEYDFGKSTYSNLPWLQLPELVKYREELSCQVREKVMDINNALDTVIPTLNNKSDELVIDYPNHRIKIKLIAGFSALWKSLLVCLHLDEWYV